MHPILVALESSSIGPSLFIPQGLSDELCGLAQVSWGRFFIPRLFLLLSSWLPGFLVQPFGLYLYGCQLTCVGRAGACTFCNKTGRSQGRLVLSFSGPVAHPRCHQDTKLSHWRLDNHKVTGVEGSSWDLFPWFGSGGL